MDSNHPKYSLDGKFVYIYASDSTLNLAKIILITGSYADIKAGLIIAIRERN